MQRDRALVKTLGTWILLKCPVCICGLTRDSHITDENRYSSLAPYRDRSREHSNLAKQILNLFSTSSTQIL